MRLPLLSVTLLALSVGHIAAEEVTTATTTDGEAPVLMIEPTDFEVGEVSNAPKVTWTTEGEVQPVKEDVLPVDGAPQDDAEIIYTILPVEGSPDELMYTTGLPVKEEVLTEAEAQEENPEIRYTIQTLVGGEQGSLHDEKDRSKTERDRQSKDRKHSLDDVQERNHEWQRELKARLKNASSHELINLHDRLDGLKDRLKAISHDDLIEVNDRLQELKERIEAILDEIANPDVEG